jgi:hypothetical protein
VKPGHSPGVVEPAEILARFVPPLDLDVETNTVKPSLFAHSGTIGMSVTRMKHAGPQELKAQQESRSYVGFVTAPSSAVRDLRMDGAQLFAIYDTALPDNKAHADVCQAIFQPRSRVSEMRRQLQLAFERVPSSAT